MFIQDYYGLSDFEFLPFEMGYLPEFYVKKAELELNETPQTVEQGLIRLRELIASDKITSTFYHVGDDMLIQFLRARKFIPQRAFSNFKSYVIIRRKEPIMFSGVRFEKLRITIENKIVYFLPYRCPDGCAILLIQLDNWDPTMFPADEVKRMVALTLLQANRDPMTQVNGYKVIFDVKSNPIRHIRFCTPHNMYLLYHGTQECLPARFKGIHILNQSLTFKAAWLLLKAFLSEKLKKRIHFHSDHTTLLKFFPDSVLPVEYGGLLKDYTQLEWFKRAASPENLVDLYGSAT